MTDMQVTIAGVTFKNPVLTCSGTFGSGEEYSRRSADKFSGISHLLRVGFEKTVFDLLGYGC